MPRHALRPHLWALAVLVGLPNSVCAESTNPLLSIFDPGQAPEIVLHIGLRRKLTDVPRHDNSSTTIGRQAIENTNSRTVSDLVAKTIPGAVENASGEFHIRGSHGQYTYYLDGAPLPSSVSGSFSDLVDPKNIETLRVYTGGFPAKYGDNLAAVFDVTARAGRLGTPHGFVQQLVDRYSTSQTTVEVGGGQKKLTYYLSGVNSSTDRRLDTPVLEPIHDDGNSAVLFGKFDYQASTHDRVVLDTAHTDARFQLPNDPIRQALGQNDVQREGTNLANLILQHTGDKTQYNAALYSHTSRLRYHGSPADLVGATPDNPLASAFEDRTADYYGFRFDETVDAGTRHKLGFGTDVDTLVGRESFQLTNSDGVNPPQVINDTHDISGGDRSLYVQDDWTPGRLLVDYGARYDIHKADTETAQLSPRVNFTYTASPRDQFHAYYDRLFQPAPIEDVRKLDPGTVAFKPERDNFYEIGYQHSNAGITTGVSGYYKTEKDVIDDNLLTGTRILEPFNVEKGYVRGLEFSTDGMLRKNVSFYANYARSWARAAGDFTGGLVPAGAPPGYFYDDHDQTQTASMGVAFNNRGSSFNIDGVYGSGLPYGSDAAGNQNIYRVDPHFIVNIAAALPLPDGQIEFTIDNLLNHPYVIKQASIFTDQEYGQTRSFGIKVTQNF